MQSGFFRSTILVFICITAFFFGIYYAIQNRNSDIHGAERFLDISFSQAKRDSMRSGLNEQIENYKNIRKIQIKNNIIPAILFNPIPDGFKFEKERKPFQTNALGKVQLPSNLDDLAFFSVAQLSELIKTKKITSLQLTQLYLNRLKKYGPKLECIITLTESLAVRQAVRADEEITKGKYRGQLHGIPYGVKDLISVKGYRTTWGSVPFRNQMIDENATVIKKLEEAGAVLIAKLTLGELAMDDVWFGGMTRNPWNYKQGSSGSSAGSASATAGGLVAFSIGSETWGSIVSPSNRCGTTGLRPTYGRVSRHGAMALSWSMDKVGPICRSTEDCAIVFNSIYGQDGLDPTLYDAPFNYNPEIDLKKIRIGYLKIEFDSLKEYKEQADSTLSIFRHLGVNLIPIAIPNKYPINDLAIILSAEAAAAFDELTRSGKDDLLVRQNKDSWPNIFRISRFIPAVEYIQANRIRSMLIQDMQKLMNDIDVYIAPPFEGDNLLLTNLTGHPCVVLPNGFNKEGTPTSITFIGQLFNEATLLAVAKKYQDATDFNLKHPVLEE